MWEITEVVYWVYSLVKITQNHPQLHVCNITYIPDLVLNHPTWAWSISWRVIPSWHCRRNAISALCHGYIALYLRFLAITIVYNIVQFSQGGVSGNPYIFLCMKHSFSLSSQIPTSFKYMCNFYFQTDGEWQISDLFTETSIQAK